MSQEEDPSLPCQVVKSSGTIRILGLVGSIRKGSYCRSAVAMALEGAASIEFVETELLDLTDYNLFLCDGLPNQSEHKDDRQGLEQLQAKLQSAQGIIVGSPEYHGSFSGVLKNSLDLCGFKEYENKIVGLVGVSGGAMGCINGMEALRTVFRALHSWVIPQQCAVPSVWKVFNADGTLKEGQEAYAKRLSTVGKVVASYSLLHHNKQLDALMSHFITGQDNFGAKKAKDEGKDKS